MGEGRLRDDTKLQSSTPPPTSSAYSRPKLFHPLGLRRPISNERRSPYDTVHVNKRNQNENKVKTRHIQIDNVLYCSNKQWNDIVKGWPHRQAPESKGRFLVNSILFGST